MRISDHIAEIEELLRDLPANAAPTVEEIRNHLRCMRELNVIAYESACRAEALCEKLEARL
jgi:hypothetical protein